MGKGAGSDMKKTLITLFSSLFLVLLIGLVSGTVSKNTAEKLCREAEYVQECARAGDFAGAYRHCSLADEIWHKREGLLQMWSVHEDTDAVGLLIAKTRAAIERKSALHTLLLCEEMRMSMEHLYHRDAPGWENIF